MPTYRSINVELHSQFDIETFPEYRPRPQQHYVERGLSGIVPQFVNEKTSTCSVYVPVFPGSQFWISYSISPPVPEDQLFLFKLFINNAHIVSWSTGKEHNWKGKTMFGLYEREYEDGRKRIERRVLCFKPPDRKTKQWTDVADAFDEDAYMEIRVHRAHASKRATRQVEDYRDTPHGKNRRGIDLVNAGRVDAQQSIRFYKFALIDPTDQPFACFRYYYRTWDQMRQLELYEEDAATSDDVTEMSIIEPHGAQEEEVCKRTGTDSETASGDDSMQEFGSEGVQESESQASFDSTQGPVQRRNVSTYRLSVPPSCKLEPPEMSPRPLPQAPHKSGRPDTSYRPHPVYPVDEWEVRTPSPVKSTREGISTPPLGRRRGLSPAVLMSVIASSWRRRGTPNSERSNDRASGRTSRSVS